MTKDEDLEPEGEAEDEQRGAVEPARREALRRPDRDSEKALGLEMARLFGINPRLLVSRPSRPEAPSAPQDAEAAEGGSEPADDGPGAG